MTAASQGPHRKMISYWWSEVKGHGNQKPFFFLSNKRFEINLPVLLRAKIESNTSCSRSFVEIVSISPLAQFI